MKKTVLFISFLMPIILLASGDSHGPRDYDIVPRVINFVIFFGILFYFLKEPVRKAYNDRINSIASRLEAIQNKLKESKEKKEQAIKDIKTAKNQAASLVETAKKEAENAQERIKSGLELELKQMKKNFEEQKDFETRKTTKKIITEILDEVFDKNSTSLDQNELIDIVQKKAV